MVAGIGGSREMFLPPALLAEACSSGLRQEDKLVTNSFLVTTRMARPSSSPRGVRAGAPVASSQDCEQARAAGYAFSPTLDKLLILAGSDLGQIKGGGKPGERRPGSSLGKENP